MQTSRTLPVIVSALVLSFPVATPAQTPSTGDPPIKFNVRVKLTSLHSQVQAFAVGCNLYKTGQAQPIASGATTHPKPPSGSYDGLINVPITSVLPGSDLGQADQYECALGLAENAGSAANPSAPPQA